MSTTLTPTSAPDLPLLPTDPDRWRQNMTPSGGSSIHCALEPLHRSASSVAPSGSEGGYLEQMVRGGLAVGLVVVISAIAPISGSGTVRVPADMRTAGPGGAVFTPRRREDDTALERPAGTVETTASAAATAQLAAASITAEDQIAAIQEGLSLSVTQLAEIVKVARGTVYGWMRGEVELPRDHGTAQRLRDLERVARDWRARSSETLSRLVLAPLGDDQPSLVALLMADTWDEPAIDRALTVLAERLGARSEERRQARDHGLGRARTVTPETVELERVRLRGIT